MTSSIGPSLRINQPVLDLGLVNFGVPGVRRSRLLHLENPTCVPVSYSLSVCDPVKFEESIITGTLDLGTANPFLNKHGERVTPADSLLATKRPNQQKTKAPELTFAPSVGTIEPYQTSSVVIAFVPRSCQRLRKVIVCHIDGGEPCFVAARGEVQAPEIAVLDAFTQPEHDVFVKVPFSFSVRIRNLTNLPANFTLEQRCSKALEIITSPMSGELSEKG